MPSPTPIEVSADSGATAPPPESERRARRRRRREARLAAAAASETPANSTTNTVADATSAPPTSATPATTEPVVAAPGPAPTVPSTTATDATDDIDAETLEGARRWAAAQPLPEADARITRVSRWHAYAGLAGGYALPLNSDVLGLQAVGVTEEDTGFDGLTLRLDGGALYGPWSFGVSLPFSMLGGVNGNVPPISATMLAGAEAHLRFSWPIGSVLAIGAQVSGGATLVFTDVAIDAQRVANRLNGHLVPTGEAALVVSQRLGGHFRLEQQIGARMYSSTFFNGNAALISLQLGIRYVL